MHRDAISFPYRSTRHWRIGRFRFDAETRRLGDGDAVPEHLAAKTAAVLECLARAGGDLVRREQLIAEVWDGNAYTGSRGITQAVWQLRRLLDAGAGDQPSAILTLAKAGYQLTLPVSADMSAGVVASVPVTTSHARTLLAPGSTPELMPGLAPGPSEPGRESVEASPQEPSASTAVAPAADHVSRRWRLLAAAAAVAVLALAAAGFAWQHALRALASAPATPPTQNITTLDGVESYPAFNHDGTRLAYVWSRDGDPELIQVIDPRQPAKPLVEIRDDGFTLARPMWLGPDTLAYARSIHGAACRIVAFDLRTRARRELADCVPERGTPFVDASPDGQWLAIARPTDGQANLGVVLHRVSDGAERVLTRPTPGLFDAQIAFSHSGRQIAVLRGNAVYADLFVVDVASGKEQRLTHDQAPAAGVAWLADDSAIAFNSARDGAVATWRESPQGGEPRLVARISTLIDLASVPGRADKLAASQFIFSDAIDTLSMPDGKTVSQIASSGRNLFGQACPDARHVLFVSMRSGRIALWAGEGGQPQPRMIELPDGIADAPGCSADGRFATSLRARGAEHDTLVIGDFSGRAPLRVLPQQASFHNITWTSDGRALVVGSDRGGQWNLWRYDIATAAFSQLTDDGGDFGREVQTASGRWLYYTHDSVPGLWRRRLDTTGPPFAASEPVTTRLAASDNENWDWHDGALWMIERDSGADRLVVRDEHGGSPRVALTFAPGRARTHRSLSVAPDGQLVLSVASTHQADIVLLNVPGDRP